MKLLTTGLIVASGIAFGWVIRPVGTAPGNAKVIDKMQSDDTKSGRELPHYTSADGERRDISIASQEAPSTEDLAASFATAYSERLPRHRLQAFSKLLENVTRENAPILRDKLLSWPVVDEVNALCRNLFFERCGEVEGLPALEAAQEVGGKFSGGLAKAVLQGWAAADIAGLRAYADSLPEQDEMRAPAIGAVVDTLAQQDVAAAAQYAFGRTIKSRDLAEKVLPGLIRAAEESKRNALITEWFDLAPEGPAKALLAHKAVAYLKDQSPEAAAEWLSHLGTPNWRKADLYWPTAKAWASKDPKAAFDWVVGLPNLPGEIAPPGLAAVIEAWVEKEPEKVVAWVSSNTEEPWWPRAARGVVKGFRDANRKEEADAFIARFPEPLRQAIINDLRAANMPAN